MNFKELLRESTGRTQSERLLDRDLLRGAVKLNEPPIEKKVKTSDHELVPGKRGNEPKKGRVENE